ncbi:hypothetical protein DET55_11496 [Bacillus mycoides]|uniref:Uncharacterized protein n=1 Tax=Bacillus mycoides TaxID=1405 RepID=A0A3D9UXG4_BACMY|nr:hypothetical protein DET63_11023 [Bacillus sp. DB-2]REF33263.1 hypothetical protein DET55_11496 [Bacillus mycoides]
MARVQKKIDKKGNSLYVHLRFRKEGSNGRMLNNDERQGV